MKRRRGMKPVAFDYYRPEALSETVALLADKGDEAAILAGGMTLGPMLNLRVVRPHSVIDISRIQALKTISVAGNVVITGAGLTQSEALRSERVGTGGAVTCNGPAVGGSMLLKKSPQRSCGI